MTILRTTARLAVAGAMLAMFLSAGGCAVMTIDVDVYKGRLASDNDVQVSELVGIVEAAQPVIQGLRDKVDGWRDAGAKLCDPDETEGLRAYFDHSRDQFDNLLSFYDDRKGQPNKPTRPLAVRRPLKDSLRAYMELARKPRMTGSTTEESRNELRAARQRLIQDLTVFGEEIRDVSNEKLVHNLIAHEKNGDLNPIGKYFKFGTRKKIMSILHEDDALVLGLQAIGNVILVQADELRHRDTFDADGKERAQWELDQLKAAMPDTADKIVNRGEQGKSGDLTATTDVIDQLLAQLTYQYTRAVAEKGKDAVDAKRLSAALDVVNKYRGGEVYLRPPAAYLRSSFPVTSLQRDPGVAWTNMLTEHANRGLPFYELFDKLMNEDKYRRTTVQGEIDRQFWQNINQVRVAGAGNTNYVVAKDDLGNWYVKNYSTDPSQIIASAKNLALFSAGSAASATLIKEAQAARQKMEAKNLGLNPATQPSAITSSDESAVDPSVAAAAKGIGRRFDAEARDDDRAIREAAAALPKDVAAAWPAGLSPADRQQLNGALGAAQSALPQSGLAVPVRGDFAGQCANDLEGFNSFRQRLADGIDSTSLAQDAKDKAKAAAVGVIKDTQLRLINQCDATVARFQDEAAAVAGQ